MIINSKSIASVVTFRAFKMSLVFKISTMFLDLLGITVLFLSYFQNTQELPEEKDLISNDV